MKKETAFVEFCVESRNLKVELEIPLYISANELAVALNSAYDLGIDVFNSKQCCLKSERPIALLQGEKELEKYGIRNGSIIYFTEQES